MLLSLNVHIFQESDLKKDGNRTDWNQIFNSALYNVDDVAPDEDSDLENEKRAAGSTDEGENTMNMLKDRVTM